MRLWLGLIVLMTSVLLSACGQSGRLYLPEQQQPNATKSINGVYSS